MAIDVLYFEGCPNYDPTVKLVREIMQTLGVDLEVREIEISGPEEAQAMRFLGSPSVRVNGRDVEPGADDRTEFAFSCRIYGESGVPPRELLVAAIESA